MSKKEEKLWVKVLLWALKLGIGALFVVTGVLKVKDPAAFAIEIHNYQLFPQLAPLMAATLPTVEVVLGVAMIAGTKPWVRGSALATGGLMLVFTLAVGHVLAHGINISCGCFGAGSGPVTFVTLLRDLALLAGCAAIYAFTAPPKAPTPAVA